MLPICTIIENLVFYVVLHHNLVYNIVKLVNRYFFRIHFSKSNGTWWVLTLFFFCSFSLCHLHIHYHLTFFLLSNELLLFSKKKANTIFLFYFPLFLCFILLWNHHYLCMLFSSFFRRIFFFCFFHLEDIYFTQF